MRNKILIYVIIGVTWSCKNTTETPTETDKAKSLILEWINKNANDPASYQPGEFSRLDTILIDYDDSQFGGMTWAKMADLITDSTRSIESAKDKRETNKKYGYSIYSNREIAADISKYDSVCALLPEARMRVIKSELEYKINPEKYLVMTHDFRAKNSFGGLINQQYLFEFDYSLTTITEAHNMNK